MRSLLLAALLALPGSAAEIEAVHPLHFSDLSSPVHPFWTQISAQTDALALAASPARALTELAAQGPAAKLAAAALAYASQDASARAKLLSLMPDQQRARAASAIIDRLPSARDDPASPLAQLSALAKTEPSLRVVFDGEKFPGLGLDGVSIGRRGLQKGGKKLDKLGQGNFGIVYDHPAVPGAVVKAVAVAAEVYLLNPMLDEGPIAGNEERTARAIARADAGPRYLGRTIIDGNPVSARERVYGDSLAALIRDRRLTEHDAMLVHELAGRLAKAGVLSDDLRSSNVMIGRTLLDPRRRAYVVDGGNLLEPKGELTKDAILDHPVVVKQGVDHHVGYFEITRTLRQSLNTGLERAKPATRWRRFWSELLDAFNPHRAEP